MGKIILCRAREAKQPLVVKDIGLKIYTLEELCYFIYNNIYFISIDFFDDDFNSFVEETGQKQMVQIIAAGRRYLAEAPLWEQLPADTAMKR